MTSSCNRCQHFQQADAESGICRRVPPQVIANLYQNIDGTFSTSPTVVWPRVRNDAVCGEFKIALYIAGKGAA